MIDGGANQNRKKKLTFRKHFERYPISQIRFRTSNELNMRKISHLYDWKLKSNVFFWFFVDPYKCH